MNGLEEGFAFVMEESENIAKWEEPVFQATVCMLMEEYCRVHNLDVIEMSKTVAETVKAVNEAFGEYSETFGKE